MNWKRVSEVVEAPPEQIEETDGLPPELSVALRHHKDALAAERNLLVSRRRADGSASKIPAEHVDDYMEAIKTMEIAHSEWQKTFEQSPDKSNSFLDLWKKTVTYPRSLRKK